MLMELKYENINQNYVTKVLINVIALRHIS